MTSEILASLEGLFQVAQTHADRLSTAMERFRSHMPLSSRDIEAFTSDDLAMMDMFITRFSKLQDLMGAKIFKAVLEYAGESADSMTLIDRLNTLEKFRVIDDARVWKDMRDMRNHLAHEYPNAPEKIADYLNQAFGMVPGLIEILTKLEAFVETLRIKNTKIL